MNKLAKLTYGNLPVSLLASLFILLAIINPAPLQTLQLKTFDWLISTLAPSESEEIILVEFGEKSVEKFGQWPFDRKDIAAIIEKLRQNQAGVIAVPVLFSEPDRAGGDNVLQQTLDNGVVIAQVPTIQNNKPDAVRRGFAAIGPTKPIDYVFAWPGALAPLEKFSQTANGVGVVASIPEIDGVVRRMPLLVNIAGNLYPGLALETIRVLTDNRSYQIKTSEAGIEFVRVPGVGAIATDNRARIWLSWNTKFTRIDATEIDQRVKDRQVILGITIEGVSGIVATPNGGRWAHEVQAQALQTILNGTSIERLAYSNFIELLVLSLLCLILILSVSKANYKFSIPIYLGFVTVCLWGSYYLFQKYNQLWDASYIIITGTFVFGHLLFNNFVREFKQKLQIKKQFGTYLSPALVEKLQRNPELLKLGGETRELSIMFTDVRGFTTISEHYGDNVQGLTQIMNRYMTAMTAKILENNGTLDKYIGDAQMAFWNAPLDDEKHAYNAVKTALAMLDDLDRFNKEIAVEGIPPFGMGLGINTGSVVVGNMGSDQRFDYTCLGDSVNLASRLEGQSKPYHVKIILGERTAEHIKSHFPLVELDTIAVKGKSKGIRIFTIVNGNGINRECLGLHRNFIRAYRRQDWTTAKQYVRSLKGNFNKELDEYYDMMLERIEDLKNSNLPSDWDGVYVATSK